MKAKITKPAYNAKNYASDKEMVSAYSVVATIKGELKEVATARCYMGRSSSASVVYASLWVQNGNIHTSGAGSAGGYGYHKESAAIQQAITSAGIELYGSGYADANGMVWDRTDYQHPVLVKEDVTKRCYIDGVGDSAITSALQAIARAAGARGKLLVVRH